MRIMWLLIVTVFALVCCGPLSALAADDVPAQPEIETLIRQLSAADPKDRDVASAALVEHGDDAVAQLRAAAEGSADPQARIAAANVLKLIDLDSAKLPSLITIDVKDAPVRDVLEAIAGQAHARLVSTSDNTWAKLEGKTVTLSVKNEPFWAVMKQVLPQFGLILRNKMPHGQIAVWLATGDSMTGPSSMSGPFMAVATRVRETRELDLSRPGERQPAQTTISVTFYAEPKVPLLGRDYNPTVEEFVDDAGHSLIDPKPAYPIPYETTPAGVRAGVLIPVADVEGRTKRVKKLKGSLRVYLQTKKGTIEVPDVIVARGVSRESHGRELTVVEMTPRKLVLSGKLPVSPEDEAPRNPGERRPWKPAFDAKGIRLFDAEGRELELRPRTGNFGRPNWRHEFDLVEGQRLPVPPLKIVWEFPVEWREIQIPFEFTDLPLP